MLRQLGVIINLPDTNHLGVQRLALVGFWMVNQRQDSAPGRTGQALPVFVFVDSVTHQVKVFAPGLETWMLYPQALLALSNAAVNGSLKAFKSPMMRQVLFNKPFDASLVQRATFSCSFMLRMRDRRGHGSAIRRSRKMPLRSEVKRQFRSPN